VIGGGYIDGVSPNLSAGWSVAGTGDFNGDGAADLLLQNGDSLAEWVMNGVNVIGGGYIDGVSPNLSAGWSVAGIGDFNGDGMADILLQAGSSLAEWQMNGAEVIGGGTIDGVSPNLSPGWSVAGVGDLNGDGKADVLLQDVNNDGSTTIAEWLMNGAEVTGGGLVGTLPSGWSIAGVGDFNGDGKSDILLQHQTGGVADVLAEWQMNGTSVIGGGDIDGVSPNLNNGWSVAGVGDYNGDGKSDILLQNANGQVAEWLMNGTKVIGGGVIGTVASPWSLV
jgi:hypothetical protein